MRARRLLGVVVLMLAACGGDGPPTPAVGGAPDTPPSVGEGGTSSQDPLPRVVFLGTSLTAGLGLSSPDEAYVARVAALADSAGLPIRAINAGVSGETSAGGLRRLDWILRDPVDVLVLELGANDGLRGQDPTAMEANLAAIIDRTRERNPGVRVVLAGMEAPPNLGAQYTQAFRDVFPRVAAGHGASLVPFLLEGVAADPDLNQADGIHPTAEGHRIVARTVWRVLLPVLEDGAERR